MYWSWAETMECVFSIGIRKNIQMEPTTTFSIYAEGSGPTDDLYLYNP